MNEKVTDQTLAERLHEAALYFFDQCYHGTFVGGPNHGQPYKACELLASRITERPCEHYAIERFDNGDWADWRPTGEVYRTREAAEANVADENARLLQLRNDAAQKLHDYRVRDYREYRALLAAGLRRDDGRSEPGDFKPITALVRWDERYRAVPVEFEDDRP